MPDGSSIAVSGADTLRCRHRRHGAVAQVEIIVERGCIAYEVRRESSAVNLSQAAAFVTLRSAGTLCVQH